MKKLITILFIFFSASVYAQQSVQNDDNSAQANLDLQELQLTKLKNKERVDALNKLSYEYRNISFEKQLFFATSAVNLSESIKYSRGKALALNRLGIYYSRKSQYDLSLKSYLASLTIFQGLNDKKGTANTLNSMGVLYYYLENYEKSLQYYSQSVQLKKELGNRLELAIPYVNIGLVYEKQKKYQQALEYHHKSLSIEEELGSTNGIAISWNYIGQTHLQLLQYDKALNFFNKSLSAYEKLGQKYRVIESKNNLGIVYTKLKDFDKAKSFLTEASQMSNTLDKKELIRENYLAFSELYASQGDYQKSLTFHKKYKEVHDQIFSKNNQSKIAILETQYETEKKDKEILRIQHEQTAQNLLLKQQKTIKNGFIAGFTLVLLLAIAIYSRFLIKKKAHDQLKLANNKIEDKAQKLQESLAHITQLEGILPICGHCKKIHRKNIDADDQKAWIGLEKYIQDRTEATFSHGICPDCLPKFYPDYDVSDK